MTSHRAILYLLLFSVPIGAGASVRISEVMYDVPGTDTGREWVEVVNEGSAVDLTTLRLFEAGVNHKITPWQGTSGTLSANAYAVIADNPTKFLEDWPTYSGPLFDSAFSLSNTGEDLEIRDAEGVTLFAIRYPTELGAQGDGNTLHYSGSGWSVGPATPGAPPGSGNTSSPSEGSGQTSSSPSPSAPSSTPPIYESSPTLVLDVVYRKVITAGADVPFSALLSYANGEEVLGAVYEWNFGDGSIATGNSVYHHYDVPGQYALVVHGTKGIGSATKVLSVEVVQSTARIDTITPEAIFVRNAGATQIDLSRWHIRADMQFFTLPARTIILPHTTTAFPFAVTKLPQSFNTKLLYPNGQKATFYDPSTAHAPTSATSFNSVQFRESTYENAPYAPLISASIYDEEGVDLVYRSPAEASAGALASAGSASEIPLQWYILFALLVVFSAVSAIILRRYGT